MTEAKNKPKARPDENKPDRLETVREATGPSTAEKAGEQEQRVNIGNAGKPRP